MGCQIGRGSLLDGCCRRRSPKLAAVPTARYDRPHGIGRLALIGRRNHGDQWWQLAVGATQQDK